MMLMLIFVRIVWCRNRKFFEISVGLSSILWCLLLRYVVMWSCWFIIVVVMIGVVVSVLRFVGILCVVVNVGDVYVM